MRSTDSFLVEARLICPQLLPFAAGVCAVSQKRASPARCDNKGESRIWPRFSPPCAFYDPLAAPDSLGHVWWTRPPPLHLGNQGNLMRLNLGGTVAMARRKITKTTAASCCPSLKGFDAGQSGMAGGTLTFLSLLHWLYCSAVPYVNHAQ